MNVLNREREIESIELCVKEWHDIIKFEMNKYTYV